MAGRGSADIVFVIDCSRSMEPCIEGVKNHIASFVDVFRSDPNGAWDLRFDFLAHDDSLQESRAVGVDRDFRERVLGAGGAYDDVDVRASLIWHDYTDLDLHVVTPSDEEISFCNKTSSCGGALDVDQNVSPTTMEPVENVRWMRGKAPGGNYRVFVENYNNRSSGPDVPFRVEVVNGSEVRHFDLSVPARDGAEREVATLRFDPSAQRGAATGPDEGSFRARSLFEDPALPAIYGRTQGRFFTGDPAAFARAVGALRTGENESPLVALDCALDFPWRPRQQTHRIVVLMTDEPVEGGNRQEESRRLTPSIIEKLQTLKAMLFLVAPASEGFEDLAAANLCEWQEVSGGDGLASVDFGKLLSSIARSITRSQTPLGAPPPSASRALFGQDRW